jgi:sugar phosphate isomerase/epimerase
MPPAEASHPAPRLLSVSHLTVLDAAPPELVSAAAGAGFDAVGIRVRPAADEPAYPMLGDTPMMRDTLARLADTGTCVLDVEVLRFRPDSRMDDALRILDAGARLQARAVLIICNDPDEDRLVDRFAAVCEAAGERGLRACLEFMIFSSVKTMAEAERVLSRADHPAGAILVDALHLQRSGGTPADVSAVAPQRLPYASARSRPGRRCPWRLRSPGWPEGRPASGPAWPTRPSPACWPSRTRLAIRPRRGSGTRAGGDWRPGRRWP